MTQDELLSTRMYYIQWKDIATNAIEAGSLPIAGSKYPKRREKLMPLFVCRQSRNAHSLDRYSPSKLEQHSLRNINFLVELPLQRYLIHGRYLPRC